MAKMSVNIKPFTVPNYVKVDVGTKNDNVIPLEDVSEETLIEMCHDFKEAVLEKKRRRRESEIFRGSIDDE